MKICFIVGAFPNMKCGVGDYCYNLANALAEYGNEVHIITSTKANGSILGKVNVHNIVKEWDFRSKDIIINELNSIQADIVHIQYPSDEYGKSFFINLLPKMIKKRFKVKVIETVHEYLNYTTKGKIRNLINYIYADEIIVVEKQYKQLIQSFVPNISSKLNINYIPISSNIPISKLNNEELDMKKKDLLGNNKIISYFGFVNELKGMELLLEIVKKIKNKRNDVKLLIIGELSESNEYHKKIITKINDMNLKDSIVITGFLDNPNEVADYLKLSNCAIFPFKNGLSERNGSFLAAYCQGIPIITTDLKEEYNKNGIWYLNPDNIEGFVDKTEYIMDNEMSIEREILLWSDIMNKHFELYKR